MTGQSSAERAQDLLSDLLGTGATFRTSQLDAILALVDGTSRMLVVERTGWGKSIVYFIATRILRERGAGPTLLVSPLLSLMRNQIDAAERLGLTAETINSSQSLDRRSEVERKIDGDEVDLLLVAPERLADERFIQNTLSRLRSGIGMLVVDEAHCISDWGHDFRPDYMRIRRILRELPPEVPVLATTATANDRVVDDIESQLGSGLRTIRGPLARASLSLHVLRLAGYRDRLAWLAQNLEELPGTGIIYCLTVRDSETVAEWLQSRGLPVAAYHAQLPPDEKVSLEERLLNDDLKALVATVALGMGFDKPNLGFVVHAQTPSSPVAYYQQVGRAGRAIPEAVAVLLAAPADARIHAYFREAAYPREEDLREVLKAVEAGDGLTQRAIEATVNIKPSRVAQCLRILSVAGAVRQHNRVWERTVAAWEMDAERVAGVREQREKEWASMVSFQTETRCLMQVIQEALDDPSAAPCGRCSSCRTTIFPVEADPTVRRQVDAFLDDPNRAEEIVPRKMWFSPDEDRHDQMVSIPPELQASPGLVLGVYGAEGIEELVAKAKREGTDFPEEVVLALAQAITARWGKDPAGAILAVPSLRSDRVAHAGQKLAGVLGIPFFDVIRKTHDNPPQKTMENSFHQWKNVDSVFEVEGGGWGTIILLDDVVDSGWTLTALSAQLREAGADVVRPVAFARSTSQ